MINTRICEAKESLCDSHFQLICTGQQILTKGKTTVLEVHISRLYLYYIYIYEGLSKCGENAYRVEDAHESSCTCLSRRSLSNCEETY